MSNLDKIVKLACKPKNAPPKAKYVDVLVSATYSDDGSLNDITRSLSLRLREPNGVVVFKALIVLHQMIRTGSTDALLSHLSRGDSLRLRNITAQQYEGYAPPSHMPEYAVYLDTRIKVWSETKHDVVATQTESNRRSDGLGAGAKARRLRHLPVEKGLLREVKQVQKVLGVLIQCKFYNDDLRDENTVLAFRMLIKDLLVLFQAGNEGVCNILEHYFEMSKTDATEAFQIYKSFISQTDKVVDYLGVVRKLHNIVNVPVPNLKHAPTGLVKALEEYLQDPNFEQNRREYKASLGVVEGKPRDPSPNPVKQEDKKPDATSSANNGSSSLISAPAVTTPPATAPPGSSQKIQDFFDSIQTSQQPTMFAGPPQPFPQQMQMQMTGPFNPFRQSMMLPQQTGMPFQQPFMQPQQTGFNPQQPNFAQPQPQPFLQPQLTGQMAFGTGSISNRQSIFPQQTGISQFGQFGQMAQGQTGTMQSQQTGFQPNFAQPQPQPLQPQSTGSNPFRQSMMTLNTNTGTSGAMSQPTSPFAPFQNQSFGQSQVQRAGSVPALSMNANNKPFGDNRTDAKPLTAQPTGSNNPFAPPGGIPAKKEQPSKGPSMNELAWNKQQGMMSQQTGFGGPGMNAQSTGFGGSQQGMASQQTGSPWGNAGSMNGQQNNGSGSGNGISDVASSFTFNNNNNNNSGTTGATSPSTNATGSSNDFLSQFGSLSMGNTGTSSSAFGSIGTNPTGQLSPEKAGSSGFIQPQKTGYGGSTVKRFQPTSNFGSSLMETLPPIPEPSNTQSNQGTGQMVSSPGSMSGQNTGNSFPFAQTGQNGQNGQNGHGQALTQSMTGLPNPFRQSTFGQPQQPQQQQAFTGGPFGAMSPFAGQNRQPQAQQQLPFGSNSLI